MFNKTFQRGNESLDQEKTCQLGKVMKQDNRKELFREREACWKNLLWCWELGAGSWEGNRDPVMGMVTCWWKEVSVLLWFG